MRCPEHGVVVGAVPWARHDSRFTRAFEQHVAWLAVNTSGSAVAELMRIAWRSVGAICERVATEAGREVDLLAGLRRIGIDEISHRKGHRYLTVVVDHDTGRLIWAAPGRDKATVEAFFDALGDKRSRRLKLVSCDMAGWIEAVLAKRCPKAKRCVDPFHVVALATEALDQIRREVWNEARRQGQGDVAVELKGTRYALWKNPENLTARQQSKLADVEKLNRPLYRAYLLDFASRRVDVNGAEAPLTAGEFDLVSLLATEADRVFTKPELLRALWGVADRSKVRALDSRASRTRCKLREAGADGFLLNYRERGYRLWEGDAASNGGPPR